MTAPHPPLYKFLDTQQFLTSFPKSSQYSRGNDWAVIVAGILLAYHQEERLDNVCSKIINRTEGNPEERSVNGLNILRQAIMALAPGVEKALEKDKSLRAPVPLSERHARGKACFSRIYAQHTDRVLENLNITSGGDLGEYAINCVYGDLVAETNILNEKVTALLEFACCLAIGAEAQTKGHMYGAHALGNTGAEIEAVVKVAKTIQADLNVSLTWLDDEPPDTSFLSIPQERGW